MVKTLPSADAFAMELERALRLLRAGDSANAEALCRMALAQRAAHPGALHLLGLCLHARGAFPEAERNIRGALKVKPNQASFHLSYANVLRELGRLPDALQSYSRSVKLDPASAIAHYNLGTAFEEAERFDEALQAYDRALVLAPDAIAHVGRGNALLALSRKEEAVAAYRSALQLDTDNVEALANCAATLMSLARHDEALPLAQDAAARQPGHVGANRTLAAVLDALGRPGEGLDALERIPPTAQDAELLRLHARALMGRRRFADALPLLVRATALEPQVSAGRATLSNLMAILGDPEAAMAFSDAAMQAFPGDIDLLQSRGTAAMLAGRLEEAREVCRQILAREPERRQSRYYLGLLDLLAGDLVRGLPNYEYRWNDAMGWMRLRPLGKPLWLGQQDLANSTLLVHAEQGMGDTMQFCRYVPHLLQRAAHVVFEVQASLFVLIRSAMPEAVEVVPHGADLPYFDYQCPLLSLPLALGTTLDTIPAKTPYLSALPQKVGQWAARLGKQRGVRVGIAWSGNPVQVSNWYRSIALEHIGEMIGRAQAAETGAPVEFIVLQTQLLPTDREALAQLTGLFFAGDALEDFSDTAALVELCDLIVSTDTSVLHLAGAMGKPAWALLSFSPDWRWLLDRADSPWYPGMRLLRQPRLGDWSPVLAQAGADLMHFAQNFPAYGPTPAGPPARVPDPISQDRHDDPSQFLLPL
jgi:tetratricopeptide (TPR) repeat protein